MDCKLNCELPRPCPIDDKVIPLLNLLRGEGGDNFNAVPRAAEFLGICVGADNPAFEKFVTNRLFHEMEIFKGDIESHFHAIAHLLEEVTKDHEKVIPQGHSTEKSVEMMDFGGPMPSYKDVEALVKSISRLPQVAKRIKTLISSKSSPAELNKHLRDAVEYWNCPCADIEVEGGKISITHKCNDKHDVPMSESGWTASNTKSLTDEIDRSMKELGKQLHECAKSVSKDIKVKDRSKTEYSHTQDTLDLSFAHFAYDVLAQMIECSTMCVSDTFEDFAEHVRSL